MKKPAVQADLLRSYSAYIRADRIESFVKHKISSVNMLRIVHDSHAFGVKPRQHKRGAALRSQAFTSADFNLFTPLTNASLSRTVMSAPIFVSSDTCL